MGFSMIRTIAVIGAGGEMGRLFTGRCREAGLSVCELDQPLTPEKLSGSLPGADLVLLCVPITVMGDVLSRIAPHLTGTEILADLCSVKVAPLKQMLDAYTGPVVGTHPLFGGTLPAEEDCRVAVCPGRGDEAAAAVSDFIARLGFIPFESTADEHDQALAYIQGLNFVSTVAYLSATAQQPRIDEFLTPSFRRRLDAARKMLTMDAEMFEAIFESNPHSQDSVRLFRSYLNVAAGGDIDLLVQRSGWWWRRASTGGEVHP